MAPTPDRPLAPRRRPSRRGSGALMFVVASLLIVVLIMALSMSWRSRGVVAQSRKAIYHERCADLADMAIKEAVHYLRINANDQEHPAFELFRAQSGGATLAFEVESLPHTREEVGRLPGYSLGYGVEVEVVRRAAIGLEQEERVPYEAVGVVRFTVDVDGPSGTEVTQKDEYGFRSILTAPPRPFDMCTFFLLDPADLLNMAAIDGEANGTIATAVELLKNYVERYQKAAEGLDQLASEADGMPDGDGLANTARRMAAAFRATVQPPQWKAEAWQYTPPNQGNTTGQPAVLHLFDSPICVFSVEEQVDLTLLDVPTRIRPHVREYLRKQPRIEQLSQEFGQTLEQLNGVSDPEDAEGIAARAEALSQEFLPLSAEVSENLQAILTAYKDFQDALVEVGGAALEDLAKRARRLGEAEQPWKSHYRFEGPGAAARATEFIDQDPPPSGAIFIDDPEEPVTVNVRNLSGRLSVVSRGDMIVQNATVRDHSEDLLILVGYGQMEVQQASTVDAALVNWSGAYRGNGRDFTGSLVLRDIPNGAPTDLILGGTLTRGPSILSGPPGNQERPPPDPSSLHIALGPVPPYHKVFHQ